MKRIFIIAIVLALAVIAVVALVMLGNGPANNYQNGGPSSGGTTGSSVNIKNLAFSPSTLTVPVGTTVTWTNDDGMTHTVTSTSGPAGFDSGLMSSGSSFSHTFDQAGTYEYICTIHPSMQGQVIVT